LAFGEKVKMKSLLKKHKINSAGICKIEDYKIKGIFNENQLFQAGSISKCLTALCVIKLVQKGKLNFLEDVNNYLKNWKIKDSKGQEIKTTLKELLSHTGGISCSGFMGHKKGKQMPSIIQILNGQKPANSERIYKKYGRGKYHYSGGGYIIIQKVLEDVLGNNFNSIMEKEIFKPLNMQNSTFKIPRIKIQGHRNKRKVGNNIYSEKAPAGLWTTAQDLSKFIREIQLGYSGKSKFISQKLIKQMLKPVIKAEGNFIALGFFIMKDKKRFYHTGFNVGYRSKFIADFKGNGIVILTNEENSKRFIGTVIQRDIE
jgi:CubicO group peptidase (beta-lactamase class C family)